MNKHHLSKTIVLNLLAAVCIGAAPLAADAQDYYQGSLSGNNYSSPYASPAMTGAPLGNSSAYFNQPARFSSSYGEIDSNLERSVARAVVYGNPAPFPNAGWLMGSEYRTQHDTVANLTAEYERNGFISARSLGVILADEAYIRSLSLEEVTELSWLARYVKVNADSPEGNYILSAVFSHLGRYDEQKGENDINYQVNSFYEAVAVSLGQSPYLWRKVADLAFEKVNNCIGNLSAPNCGWTAVLLADYALPDENGMSRGGEWFERRMKQLIDKMNYLKNEKTDYVLTGVPNVLSSTNQTVLIELFAQANNFFAAKDDDGFLKMMCTTGGLNGLGRCAVGGAENANNRFSDTGEVFYLAAPTPGTTGTGEFADSDNGRRHFILTQLISGLFTSYANTRDTAESSRLMQTFVREKIQLNSHKEFGQYLYMALQGMRIASELHNTDSLDGWEKEAETLQKELYSNLKKGYPGTVGCITTQGACEVAAEWMLVGKVLNWGWRGTKALFRVGERQIIKRLSARTLMNGVLIDLAIKQGGKNVVRWTRKGVYNVLKRAGWKPKTPSAPAH